MFFDVQPNRRNLLAGAGALAALTILPARARATDAQTVADRLVEAMGGRDAWLRIGGLFIRARHFETDVAAPYENRIYMALDRPLIRIEGKNADMNRIRAINGESGWRQSEVTALGPLNAEVVRGDLNWWEAHVYRNIWRLARRDPAIIPRLHADGRLELYRPDGTRLMWYRLNLRAEPVAFAPFYSESPTILGPLADRPGGLRSPVWTSSADGSFRVDIREWLGTVGVPKANYARP